MSMKELHLREAGIRWRDIEGELVAVDLDSSTYLGANRSGLELWRALAAGARHDDLVSRLVDVFGIERARATRDVDAFLADASAKRLLRD
jgi:hypothetical protein